MKAVELLKIGGDLLKTMSRADVFRDDYKYVSLHEKYYRMREKGVKHVVAVQQRYQCYCYHDDVKRSDWRMMYWVDIASIVFVCVTMNHLGLIKAIKDVSKMEIPIVECPKCITFWSVLTFQVVTNCNVLASLAISFLASYAALWLELLEGYIDTLYYILYEKIYSDTENDTIATDTDDGDSAGSVS